MSIDSILDILSQALTNNIWIGFLIAFAAGVLTFFTPCALTSIPVIVGYVGGTSTSRKKAFVYSVFVVLGQTIVFLAIGIATFYLGKALEINYIVSMIFYILLGVLMLVMSLEMWGITNFLSKACGANIKTSKKGILGAFLIGLFGGVIASPCDFPVLISILGLITTVSGGLVVAIIMILLYAVGRSILLVVAGTSIGFTKQLAESPKFAKASKVIKIILGIAIAALGVYMIFLGIRG